MAKLINIAETPEAITAEAVSLVWETYEAPRKRLPRARIVEHRFTVSIPKVSEDVAPLAFVVEHFPQMTLDYKEYRAGYDQPIRWYSGEFYTPARMRNRLRYLNWRNANEYDSADPVTYMTAHVKSLPSETESERERRAEAIARDAIRADSHAGYTADSVAREVKHMTYGRIIISGEIWEVCSEPAYEYCPRDTWGGRRLPEYIDVRTSETDNAARNLYGALDHIALAVFQRNVYRAAFIDVKRPDLVSVDRIARRLDRDAKTAAQNAESAREHLERLEKAMQDARENLAKKEAEADRAEKRREQYESDPRAFWLNYAEGNHSERIRRTIDEYTQNRS